MCGITGFTHKSWSPEPDRINRAAATIAHRGPDQQGVYRSSVASLAATRLKILDLTAGDQPIKSDDGNTVIVFNGEIYNHLELRRELEQLGHRFHSRADTETVLHAFLEWDASCFCKLRGMFAIALWDEAEQRLLLARDRMGIKPLYIARKGQDLFFGSELKAILIHPEIDRRLGMAGLSCYLALNYVPCPWTLVDGIEKIPPGYWLEWHRGEIHSQAYWNLPFVRPRLLTMDAAKEELDSLLEQAIREHLLSDVPLGVWLSGGIDSSTILHYAAKASSSTLKTLSISFQGRAFDETPYIREVAARYGTDHEQFDLNPAENLAGAIEEFAYYSDEPTADAGALPVWFLSKMSKKKVTVTLSGEGSDEVFGGYLTYRANRLAEIVRQFPSAAIRVALGVVNRWPVSDEKISFEYKLKRFLEGCLLTPDQAHGYWNGTFSTVQKEALLVPPFTDSLDRILQTLRERSLETDKLAGYLWFDQKYFLPDDILNKVDRMSMAHAVEVRPPFLDHRIVEFAASLPSSLKIHGTRQKVILKELMKDKLPASVLTKKKTGLDIPSHEWLRGPLRGLMLDTLNDGVAEHPGLFKKGVIDRYVSAHLERRANLGYHLWGLMILFLWMRKWRIQTEPLSAWGQKATESVLTST